jgi:hypothetical protein
VVLESRERHENSFVGKRWHAPLQDFLSSRSSIANSLVHLAQFLLSFFGSDVNVFGDGGGLGLSGHVEEL